MILFGKYCRLVYDILGMCPADRTMPAPRGSTGAEWECERALHSRVLLRHRQFGRGASRTGPVVEPGTQSPSLCLLQSTAGTISGGALKQINRLLSLAFADVIVILLFKVALQISTLMTSFEGKRLAVLIGRSSEQHFALGLPALTRVGLYLVMTPGVACCRTFIGCGLGRSVCAQ